MDIVLSGSGSATTSGLQYLWHGSDLETIDWIAAKGLSHERMLATNPHSWAFWTSIDPKIGCIYGDLNSARGTPAVIRFAMPQDCLQGLVASGLAVEQLPSPDKAYYFLPTSFATVNCVMTDVSVHLVTELKATFDE